MAKSTEIKKCRGDFRFGSVLGVGSYSTVLLAEEKSTKAEYAIKIIAKSHIVKEKKTAQIMREKECLRKLNHPFFVKLYFTFQDSENLYFGLSVARNGELLEAIKQTKGFDFEGTQFYAAELVEAVEHMHSIDVIHRDLKPENILLDDNFHIQVTDFGTAKSLDQGNGSSSKSSSFVGTAQYVSPELLKDKQACKSSDLWALGCIIYHMHCGKPPFQAQNEYLTFQLIIKCEYEFPSTFHPLVRGLVENLLVTDPQSRLGANSEGGYQEIKSHDMFEGINWETVTNRTAPDFMKKIPKCENGQNILGLVDNFNEAVITNITGQNENNTETLASSEPSDVEGYGLSINMPEKERRNWLQKQKATEWDSFCDGKLILKCGIMEKKRGISVKLRQFLLTEGPRIIYIDPATRQVKGEIPWTNKLRVEMKTFKIFYVHTPNRTYHLIDKSNNAIRWCKKILEVSQHYFGSSVNHLE